MIDLLPGRRVPRDFGDADAEHLATRRSAGLFDFSVMGCVEIAGPDAVELLERVQTRHVRDLPAGRIRYTLVLRDDGTVLNDATVWRLDAERWLFFIGRREDLARVFGHAITSGADAGPRRSANGSHWSSRRSAPARVRDRSAAFAVIALQGPAAKGVLARVLRAPDDLPYFAFVGSRFRETPCLVARIGYSGEFGYEIIIDAEGAVELWKTLRDAGAAECGFTAVNTLRIEAGRVLFTNELAVHVTPAELGLERLVERGTRCRIAPRRRLAGFLLDGAVEPERAELERVQDDRAIVTSACRSPLFERWIGLGFVSDECRYTGTRVRFGGNERATVTRLPFYDPLKRRVR